MYSVFKANPLLKMVNNSVISLPSPANLSNWWNLGSLLGLCLILQIATGLFLSMHYSSDLINTFSSISHLVRDVNYGWLVRLIHANGASLFFVSLYLHIGRGIYYGTYKSLHVWMIGVVILLMTMATAFLGYVLPWGQMSFWGATVITSLFSAIPYFGDTFVTWLWGNLAVTAPTLTRFFTFHFLLPFIIAALVCGHLLFLHTKGSSNPLGLPSNTDKVSFHPYFSSKDILGMLITLFMFMGVCTICPQVLMDPENFIPANPLIAPLHIQPEWYFLFAYAILRSIPNKLGGVIALALAVLILVMLPFLPTPNFQSMSYYPISKALFWNHVNCTIMLSWIGARPVEDPYILVGQLLMVLYFSYYFLFTYTNMFWDLLLK